MKLLLLFLGGLRKVAAGAIGLAVRHPWPVACAILLGLTWWQWSGKQDALAARDQARTALKTEKKSRDTEGDGWRRQVAAAHAATAAAERKSQEIAHDAQATHAALAADTAGLRDYIADRRLRPSAATAASPRTAEGLGAQVPAAVTAGTVVAADEADLAACDSAYVYAASAYGWAQGLITSGLAAEAPAP